MRHRACMEHLEGLVALAHGRSGPAATEDHLRSCSACAGALEQLRQMVAALRTPHHDPPRDVLEAAIGLMPATIKRFRARLVLDSLAMAGSRAAEGDSFQLVFEAKDLSARLMYVPEGRGWQVSGRVAGEGSVCREDEELDLEPGGLFTFRARDLADTRLLIRRPGVEIEIPSAEEARAGGPPEPR